MKGWKCWVTGLWLTNHIEKAGWQWRTLADRHPSHWRRDAELSLRIHTRLQSHSKSSLLKLSSIPSQIVPLSRSLFCPRLVMLCPAVEARQKDADGADGSGQVVACCRSFQSSLSSLLYFKNYKMHKCASVITQTCSNWFFFSFLLFWIYVTFWSHSWTFMWISFLPSLQLTSRPCWSPRWPLQGYKLSGSKLYHEQIMEHDTFSEKSNTHTVTQGINTLKQKPKAADLSPFLYGLHVYYFLGGLLK